MMEDKMNAADLLGAGLVARSGVGEQGNIVGIYHVKCFDKDGNLKWEDDIHNLVTTVGKNDMLDKYLSGSAWTTGTVYMGLVNGGSTPTYAAADTMASHAGWTELNISASSGARLAVTFNAASAGSKATPGGTPVAWSISSSGTVAGCFIVVGGTSTNANTTGVLFSAGSFSGGNRAVINGDTLNVSYSVGI